MLAFQQDESLFNEAFERRIVVVTPTTLLATLRTVANIWAIERRNRSTEKLAEQAGKIYDKLVIVVDRFEKVGSQLSTVQKSYDEAWNSLRSGRGNLVKQADDFRKLGVRVKKELSRTLVEDAEAEHELESATVNEAQLPLMDDN
jgi:DNA recombination protein RmuC